MKRTLVKLRNSRFRNFLKKHEKYAPVLFFIAGFVFDSLTLGRIDRLYDLIVLCLHMTSLTITLFLFNLVDDGRWKNTFLGRYEEYFPLAIQFFFGGLSSAFVIYFSRSVSLSRTISFFIILVLLLFANELLKKRISNKYLQFGVYFFISFTFFTFIIPVFISEMNTNIFLISGVVSLISSLLVITIIYGISPSTRLEVHLGKLFGMILFIYALINVFYFLKLIPPVPLAMQTGIVAHNIESQNNSYYVTYETDDWYIFWRDHRLKYIHEPDENVYVFTSIFAPTDLKKSIFHRWTWYNEGTGKWEIVEDIGYEITGGRDGGYRGYTYKNNVKPGTWKVEVITEEELVLGVVDFEIVINPSLQPKGVRRRTF
ncbi:hypothetical protein KCTC52924_00185 [Arenibacter antarcticus]|uniref:DUF2914 domain-containing protein n=1 Tax=Arenibacter antarcticus TaxID=2040469 RepID=A0ABW5VP77_9FLAO|nr:DUF2914 domain-containing protein [Arenibacter sp. H213]MCM4169050.1 DUF2914 domain-containing protein [Arenibacter sp. H213]